MFSGGDTISAADMNSQAASIDGQIQDEYGQYNEGAEQLNALTSDIENKDKVAGEQAAEEYVEADREQQRAESDESTAESRTRYADDAVKSAKEGLDEFNHNNETAWKQLDPQRQQVKTAYDLANFYQWNYDRELYNAWSQACLEGILESQNAGGAALVSFHAACMKMSAAQLGLSTNVSCQIYLDRYLRIPDMPENRAIEQRASADAQAANLAAEEKQVIDRSKDNYYQQKLAEKKERYEEEKAKYDVAVQKLATAKAEAEGLKAQRDSLNAEYRAANDTYREQQQNVTKQKQAIDKLEADKSRLLNEYERNYREEQKALREEQAQQTEETA